MAIILPDSENGNIIRNKSDKGNFAKKIAASKKKFTFSSA